MDVTTADNDNRLPLLFQRLLVKDTIRKTYRVEFIFPLESVSVVTHMRNEIYRHCWNERFLEALSNQPHACNYLIRDLWLIIHQYACSFAIS